LLKDFRQPSLAKAAYREQFDVRTRRGTAAGIRKIRPLRARLAASR
jgi:hypothetical protein